MNLVCLTLWAAALLPPAGQDRSAAAPARSECVDKEAECWSPAFSPDSKRLAYLRYSAGEGRMELVLADGAESAVLVDLGKPEVRNLESCYPYEYLFPKIVWASDGKSIYVLRQLGRNIECSSVDISTRTRRALGEVERPENHQVRQFLPAPGNKLVVSFGWVDSSRKELPSMPGQPLVLFDPASSTVRLSAESYRMVFEAPKGDFLYATTPTGVWKLDEELKPKPEALATFDEPTDIRRLFVAGKGLWLVLRPGIMDWTGEYARVEKGEAKVLVSSPVAFDQMAPLADGLVAWAECVEKGALKSIHVGKAQGGRFNSHGLNFGTDGYAKLDRFFPSVDGRKALVLLTPKTKEMNPLRSSFLASPFVLVSSETKELALLTSSGKEFKIAPLKLEEGLPVLQDVAWAPDGKSFAFVRSRRVKTNFQLGYACTDFILRGQIWKATVK